jgi:hypothetical protein
MAFKICGTGKTLEDAMKVVKTGENDLRHALAVTKLDYTSQQVLVEVNYGGRKKPYKGVGATYEEAVGNKVFPETADVTVTVNQSYNLTAIQNAVAKAKGKTVSAGPTRQAPTLDDNLL